LTPAETRQLYHALLPTGLLEDESAAAAGAYSLQERAELAIAARRAAKKYARERSLLPVSMACAVLDGVRQLLAGGVFRPDGYSDEQIWLKYAGCSPSDLPEGAAFDDEVYRTILEKACSTNRHVDVWCGVNRLAADVADATITAANEIGGV